VKKTGGGNQQPLSLHGWVLGKRHSSTTQTVAAQQVLK